MTLIRLKPIQSLEHKQVKNLADILNEDIVLRESMDIKKEAMSCENFIAHNKQWSKENNAKMFAIILESNAIGLISLSHINSRSKTAQIGYWVANKYWSKGYTTESFRLILDIARENNIRSVTCSIDKGNQASKRIWQKFNARFKERDNKIIPLVRL